MRAELRGSGIHVSLIEPGAVRSKIAINALPWFLKNIDHEHSVHREGYKAQLARLSGGGSTSRLKPGPEIVHAVLRHALLSTRPRPHYVVTIPARTGAVLKRLLPAALFYRILALRS
jgi:NAD(P)-dependent dehydrogenase (short-subunit alcohol dehydrogenase family)